MSKKITGTGIKAHIPVKQIITRDDIDYKVIAEFDDCYIVYVDSPEQLIKLDKYPKQNKVKINENKA